MNQIGRQVRIRRYRRKEEIVMYPWRASQRMDSVRISSEAIEAGSPKDGDMVAFRSGDPDSRWLVEHRDFVDNWEEVKGEF